MSEKASLLNELSFLEKEYDMLPSLCITLQLVLYYITVTLFYSFSYTAFECVVKNLIQGQEVKCGQNIQYGIVCVCPLY